MNQFKLEAPFKPAGDQPKAIRNLVKGVKQNEPHQVLLGVTGSGKTFSMAHVIERTNLPSLVLAPNKTLAAQLYAELKELFPSNAVEFFVSYYDYYQPEAYIPSTGTYIEKESSINEQIDRMRHSATRSLFERTDVIIVASVSCIYGIGSCEEYENMTIKLKTDASLNRDNLLRDLVKIQYRRKDLDFHRGTFRVRGDVVEVHPPYEEDKVLRIEFFGHHVEALSWVDPFRGHRLQQLDEATIFPASHYVTSEERLKLAVESIRDELQTRIRFYKDEIRKEEAQRIEEITLRDLEYITEMGFCPGIENYSRHLTGRQPGEAPPTLIEYFPENFLIFIDESHVTVPQLGAMYRGDRARKTHLINYGFRLPSAYDNRPLNFKEFEKLAQKVIFVSATPGDYELTSSEGLVVEQIIRPTGLLDPKVEVRSAQNQVDDLLKEIRVRVKRNERTLVTTLTKKSAEDLTDYLESLGVKVKYLHSDVHTVERTEILRDLRLGAFDVLVGINLLREGLDLPEVSLVAITDADKEGFLRSTRSLIQTIGRVARHKKGLAILYADRTTESMRRAMDETNRRRKLQQASNKKRGVTPRSISKKLSPGLLDLYEQNSTSTIKPKKSKKTSDPQKIGDKIKKLRGEMRKCSEKLDFEGAAALRDEVRRLELQELTQLEGSVK